MPESISSNIANKIVNILKNSINHDITFMDMTGRIIACTNTSRVGDFHEGSIYLIKEKLQILPVYKSDSYAGTCEGVNMPIRFHEQIVGVIGITGDVERVTSYAAVIQHMTELLLLENEYKQEAAARRFDQEHFLQQWIQQGTVIDDNFIAYGQRLGINILEPKRAVICRITRYDNGASMSDPLDHVVNQKMNRLLKKFLGKDSQSVWYFSGHHLILMFCENRNEELAELLLKLRNTMMDELQIRLVFGCDSICVSGSDMCDGYRRALQSLYSAGEDRPVVFFDDIDLELLMQHIPAHVKQEYVNKVFGKYAPEQIDEWCLLVDLVVKHNGSLNAVANQLYIHKNTVQYRIQKLQNQTGYDCRSLQDIPVLYLASLIWSENRKKTNISREYEHETTQSGN